MHSNVLVTSKSNMQYIDQLEAFHPFERVIMVDRPPSTTMQHERRENEIYIALGGGSVIDTAKLISGQDPCYAIPTTASGSACTSWAVIWKKEEKISQLCRRPILIDSFRYLNIELPHNVIESTLCDCHCHIIESLASKNRTFESIDMASIANKWLHSYTTDKVIWQLIQAGNYAGRAINITGTNFFHAISYVLTLEHGLEHGQALKTALELPEEYDWNDIIKKAKKYTKFGEMRP